MDNQSNFGNYLNVEQVNVSNSSNAFLEIPSNGAKYYVEVVPNNSNVNLKNNLDLNELECQFLLRESVKRNIESAIDDARSYLLSKKIKLLKQADNMDFSNFSDLPELTRLEHRHIDQFLKLDYSKAQLKDYSLHRIENSDKTKMFDISHFVAGEFGLECCFEAFKSLVNVLFELKSRDITRCVYVFGMGKEIKLDKMKKVINVNGKFYNTDILLMNWIYYIGQGITIERLRIWTVNYETPVLRKIEEELSKEDGELAQFCVFKNLNRAQSLLIEHCLLVGINLTSDAFKLWNTQIDNIESTGLNYEQLQKAGIYILYLTMKKMTEYNYYMYVGKYLSKEASHDERIAYFEELKNRAYVLSDFEQYLNQPQSSSA